MRASDPVMAEQIRELLVPHLVYGEEPPPNIALAGGAEQARHREVHQLWRSCVLEVRSPSPGRVLRALLAQLDAYLPPPAGLVRVAARVLLGSSDAVLVDRRLADVVHVVEGRLVAAGYRLVDTPSAELDPHGEVVLRAPRLDAEPEALVSLDASSPPDAREVVLDREARIPLRAVVALDGLVRLDARRSSAQRLAALAPLVTDHTGALDPAGMELLGRLLERDLVLRRQRLTPSDLVELVRAGR